MAVNVNYYFQLSIRMTLFEINDNDAVRLPRDKISFAPVYLQSAGA